MSKSCRWICLPTELIYLILEELDFHSLLRCTEVCRGMNSLLKDSLLLELAAKLAAAGMTDGSSATYTTAVRLDMLKAHQDAWSHLRWSQEPLSYSVSSVRLWELIGGVLGLYSYSPEDTYLKLVRFPSIHRGIAHREWQIPLDFKVGDFSMDPSADLLVAVTRVDLLNRATSFTVHFLSLETGRPHPKARQPEIRVDTKSMGDAWSYDIRILDDHMAIMFSPEFDSDDTELTIWNWETGTMVKVKPFSDDLKSKADEGSVFHSTFRSCVSNESEDTVLAEIVLIDIHDEEVGDGYSLHLPSPPLEFDIYALDIVSESPPTSRDWHSESNVPFATSLDDRLIVINYRLLNQQDEDVNYALFVPLSVLIYHFRHGRSKEEDFLQWNQWGPQNTRLLPINFSDVWVCYVHGMMASVYDAGTETFRLFDFTKLGVRYDLEKGERRPETEYLTEGTVVEKVFGKEPVCSSMPGRIRTGKIPLKSVEAVMLVEDALVFVTEGDNAALHVYSF